jgi:hypothetical protein
VEGFSGHRDEPLGSAKDRTFLGPAEQLLASRDRLCAMDFVYWRCSIIGES